MKVNVHILSIRLLLLISIFIIIVLYIYSYTLNTQLSFISYLSIHVSQFKALQFKI